MPCFPVGYTCCSVVLSSLFPIPLCPLLEFCPFLRKQSKTKQKKTLHKLLLHFMLLWNRLIKKKKNKSFTLPECVTLDAPPSWAPRAGVQGNSSCLCLCLPLCSLNLTWTRGPRIRIIEETEAALFRTKGALSVVYLLLLERPSAEQRRLGDRRV